MEELQSGILKQSPEFYNTDGHVQRRKRSRRQKKKNEIPEEIALFYKFRHLFSSTYNLATLLRK
ncbi:MAG: hypothetical protein ACYCOR_01595 [Acidobacteriaceae bacterium]